MQATNAIAASLLIAAGAVAVWKFQEKPTPPAQQAPANLTPQSSSPEASTPQATSPWTSLPDPSIRWQLQVQRLRSLDASLLTPQDIQTLFALLRHQPAPRDEEHWWVIVNEIMEQMRKQAIAPDRITPSLVSIIADPTAPEVLRDYAVQHLGQWLAPAGLHSLGTPSETEPANLEQGIATLAQAVSDPSLSHTSIPGTTLMVLVSMADTSSAASAGPSPLSNHLNAAISQLQPWLKTAISGDSNLSIVTRTSAIQAAGMLRRREHHPAIRDLATSSSTNPSVKLSAIAALGMIAEPEDHATLTNLASGSSKYRFAAQTALKNLSQ